MSIRAEDKIEVCKLCLSADLDGLDHGRWVATSSPEDGEQVCLWPCGHEVYRHEVYRCLVCQPLAADEPF